MTVFRTALDVDERSGYGTFGVASVRTHHREVTNTPTPREAHARSPILRHEHDGTRTPFRLRMLVEPVSMTEFGDGIGTHPVSALLTIKATTRRQ